MLLAKGTEALPAWKQACKQARPPGEEGRSLAEKALGMLSHETFVSREATCFCLSLPHLWNGEDDS